MSWYKADDEGFIVQVIGDTLSSAINDLYYLDNDSTICCINILYTLHALCLMEST